jgi:hypothetical protein
LATDEQEDRAIDALLVLALSQLYREPTEADIEEFMNDDTPLDAKDQAMLDKIGENNAKGSLETELERDGCHLCRVAG